ncbi:MAG: YlxM family DNA-binding protein [Bacillota bacterium]
MIGKVTRMAWLYDFYGQLLTEKQRQLVELHYHQDLSLGEIADENGTSRQAVFDVLKRAENTLEDYEAKLGLVDKFREDHRGLEEILSTLEEYRQTRDRILLDSALGTLRKLIESNS